MVQDRKRVQKIFELPSRTKQSFKDECDINKIMKRFKKVMGAEYLNRFNGYTGGQFGDFSNVTDYRTAIEQVSQARGVFEALPAKVRARFQNDAAEFLDFCHNPANVDEMVSLGLATKRAPEKDAPSGAKANEASKEA